MPTQIIVTHRGNLKKKYGPGLAAIDKAVKRLVTADAARGITDTVIALDHPSMGQWRAKALNEKSFKQAIDHVYLLRKPDYILVLGGPDIVPHQSLNNPIGGDDAIDDPVVPSDLPYACNAAYSKVVKNFIGPSRVVARLPDLPGFAKAELLVGLLDNAASWKPKAKASTAFFGLSADKWRKSTGMSLAALFGTGSKARLSPLEGPSWKPASLKPDWHFINCHGAKVDPQFYGEKAGRFPVAHESTDLTRKVTTGTVVAAECCYGAELYDPSGAPARPISASYLAERAIGFMGSTTVAYGPADDNGSADLICRFFLDKARRGWSLGSAFLEARLMFVKASAPLSPIDLKTIAQFILLADPSLRAVSGDEVVRKAFKGHSERRVALAAQADLLTRGADAAEAQAKGAPPADIRRALVAAAAKDDYEPAAAPKTFDVAAAANRSARSMVTPLATEGVRFHLLMTEPKAGPKGRLKSARTKASATTTPPTRMIVLGQEVAGQLVKVERLYARSTSGSSRTQRTTEWQIPTRDASSDAGSRPARRAIGKR